MPKRKTYQARITVPIEYELLEMLEDLSREKGVSIAGLVRTAIREWLKEMKLESNCARPCLSPLLVAPASS